MIISHRGRGTGKRENSLPSFEEALRLGADAIECDVHLTSDQKVILLHDDNIKIHEQTKPVSQMTFEELSASFPQGPEKLIVIDDLFDFLKSKNTPIFVELKDSSQRLLKELIEKINNRKLWEQIIFLGFNENLEAVFNESQNNSKIRIMQLIKFPLFSYLFPPKKSYAVSVGWFEDQPYTVRLFRTIFSPNRLKKLHLFYEKHGFKTLAGVVNHQSGFEYFDQAGITDIFTDNIKEAALFKSKKGEITQETLTPSAQRLN